MDITKDFFKSNNKDKEYDKADIERLLKVCYKKLKSDVYFDTSNVFLRKKIADFEEDIEKNIEILADALITDSLGKYETVGYNCLPKLVTTNDEEDENYIKNYVSNKDYKLNKITYFIDLDIEAHILGVLWILLFGKKLEKLYGRYTYGNKLLSNIENDNIDLFKPYFNEYENWKNNGIKSVEKMIDLKKKSFMISLDIQDYYYSVNVSFDKLKKDLDLDIDFTEDEISSFDLLLDLKPSKRISKISKIELDFYIFNFIENIFGEFNKKLRDDNIIYRENLMIPIGFAPSKIIANWYLKELDTEIIDKLNPMYYGRYIDDIIIVLPIYNKKNIKNYKYILNDYFCNNGIFKYALYNCEKEIIFLQDYDELKNLKEVIRFIPRDELGVKGKIEKKLQFVAKKLELEIKIDIFANWDDENFISNLDNLFEKLNEEKNKTLLYELYIDILTEIKFESSQSKKLYIANGYYNKSNLTNDGFIAIQEAKVRVFEFNHNGSKALIEAFKSELKKNASVFRFLPEKTEVLKSFDRETFKIDYLDSINKLSDVKGFDISKYKLSKFLARIIYSDKLENDDYTKELDSKILWAFKDNRCVEYYTLWEKVLVYYIINNKYWNAYKFIKNIIKSINNLKIEIDKSQLYYSNEIFTNEKIQDNLIKKTKYSLIKYLKVVISLVYALDDSLFEDYWTYLKNKDKLSELEIIKHMTKNIDISNLNIEEKFIDINNDKDKMRQSNMIRHDLVREVLLNYTNLVADKRFSNSYLNLIDKKIDISNSESRYRCTMLNKSYNNREKRADKRYNDECKQQCNFGKNKDFTCKNEDNCKYELSSHAIEYSPRFVHLHELIIYEMNYMMAKGHIISGNEYISRAIDNFYRINGIEFDHVYKKRILNSVENIKGNNLDYYNIDDYLFTQKEAKINIFNLESEKEKKKLKIGIVNMRINEDDIVDSFNKVPNLSDTRLEKINKLLNSAVKNGAEMIVFPEVSIPYQWLGAISNFANKNDVAIICGLEHIIYENKLCCNYLATILPEKYKSYKYTLIKVRLKNTYSPREKQWVSGYKWKLPIMIDNRSNKTSDDMFIKEYDLFRWRGIDFSAYSCFELANIKDRALFRSYVDLLIGSVHNKDTNYYSNIIESLSRDIHCYFVQVNNSELGDNRVISPSSTIKKNIVQVAGGLNDVVLIGEIDIEKLRAHQQLDHSLQIENNDFKPSPPEFSYENVRVRNKLPL